MRKLALFTALVACLSVLVLYGEVAAAGRPTRCTTIKDGTLKDRYGNPLVLGYDVYGYNYHDHTFMGFYENLDRPETPAMESESRIYTYIEWNDAWLSRKDCDGDGQLDRHYGYPDYQGSGAWKKVYEWGRSWDYSTRDWGGIWYQVYKVVAVPLDAVLKEEDGYQYWYTADGKKIGLQVWGGPFAMTERYVVRYPLVDRGGSAQE